MLICSYQSVSIVLYMCVMLVLLYDKTEEDRRQKTEDRGFISNATANME